MPKLNASSIRIGLLPSVWAVSTGGDGDDEGFLIQLWLMMILVIMNVEGYEKRVYCCYRRELPWVDDCTLLYTTTTAIRTTLLVHSFTLGGIRLLSA